jgi:glycosyltransferase involved in cell wall biosynthesis
VTTISFVVPTYNSSRTIAACVQSLKTQSVGDVEVVVVDNHSKDGTADLALQAGADIVMAAGPERCAQRNRGFDASHGDIVVFIDSDMRVTAQVASQIVALLRSPSTSATSPSRRRAHSGARTSSTSECGMRSLRRPRTGTLTIGSAPTGSRWAESTP